MNQKQIGIILLILGILMSMTTFYIKNADDQRIAIYEQATGSCFLESGSCLHADRDMKPFYLGFGLSLGLLILGSYLVFFDKTQRILFENQQSINHTFKQEKIQSNDEEKFHILLSALNIDEKKVLKVIKTEPGITQSTLKYRLDMSKTKLSLVLQDLEKKNLIYREKKGSTNKVFFKGFSKED